MMDDLISRKAALAALGERPTVYAESAYGLGSRNQYDSDRLAIETVPSVDAVPERRGKWIIYVISPFDGEDVKCSECGQRGCAPYWDYCPNCGARMEDDDE